MAVTSPERWPVLPDTPALAEAVKGYEAENWYGIAGPPGLPAAIVETLSAAIRKVMTDPAVDSRLASLVGAVVTQATVSGNTLLLWIGAPPKSADAKCLWVNPPWRIERESGQLVGSADIPWTANDFENEDAFRRPRCQCHHLRGFRWHLCR